MTSVVYHASSESETDLLGAALAKLVPDTTVISLVGTLGAGKTRLVQAVAVACGLPADDVNSPTFVLCQHYQGTRTIHHFDAYRLQDDEHILLVAMHHIVTDGWSLAVLVRELTELYRARLAGEAPELTELTMQYADFAHWQRTWYEGARDELLGFWRRTLAALPVIELPTDRPRPPMQTFAGAVATFSESLTTI